MHRPPAGEVVNTSVAASVEEAGPSQWRFRRCRRRYSVTLHEPWVTRKGEKANQWLRNFFFSSFSVRSAHIVEASPPLGQRRFLARCPSAAPESRRVLLAGVHSAMGFSIPPLLFFSFPFFFFFSGCLAERAFLSKPPCFRDRARCPCREVRTTLLLVAVPSFFLLGLRNCRSFLTGYFDSEFRGVAPVDLELVRPARTPDSVLVVCVLGLAFVVRCGPRRLVSRTGPFLAVPPPIEDVAGGGEQ